MPPAPSPHPRPPEPASNTEADERDFEAFAQSQDRLDLEAAAWAVRRRSGLDAAGRSALRDWLAGDPRHAVALDDMEATLGGVRGLPAAEVARLRAGLRPQDEALRQMAPACSAVGQVESSAPTAADPVSSAAPESATASPPIPVSAPASARAFASAPAPAQPFARRPPPARSRLLPQMAAAAVAFALVSGS